MTSCPACRAALVDGQEYCLECGARQPGPGRLGQVPTQGSTRLLPLIASFVVAATAAAVAIGATWDPDDAEQLTVGLGGSQVVRQASGQDGLAAWPANRTGWTIVLVSVPKQEGRNEAVDRAREARQRGLVQVGVLDSAKVPSLRPGYWAVFSGLYATKPEATSDLQRARSAVRTATTRQIAG